MTRKATSLTAETLQQLMHYEPDTGRLYWNPRRVDQFTTTKRRSAEEKCTWWNSRYADTEAFTTVNSKGYLKGEVFDRAYLAHRIIWCLMVGEWPEAMIDHQDGDRTNNRWQNLRAATQNQNARNRKSKTGSSKYLGVYWHCIKKKWVAAIRSGGRSKYLGSFVDEADAARVYDNAARQIHGEFACPNFPDAA